MHLSIEDPGEPPFVRLQQTYDQRLFRLPRDGLMFERLVEPAVPFIAGHCRDRRDLMTVAIEHPHCHQQTYFFIAVKADICRRASRFRYAVAFLPYPDGMGLYSHQPFDIPH